MFLFLSMSFDYGTSGIRLFDPLGSCTGLFTTLPLFVPVTRFSGFNMNGEACVDKVTEIFGPNLLGEIRHNALTVRDSLLANGLVVDLIWMNVDDWSSHLKYSKPDVYCSTDDIRVTLSASLAALRVMGTLVIRVADFTESNKELLRDVSYYFDSFDVSVSKLSKASCNNMYVIYRGFAKARYLKGMLEGSVLDHIVDHDIYKSISEAMNEVAHLSSLSADKIREKSKMLNCGQKLKDKRLANLVKLQRSCVAPEVNKVFVRTTHNVGGGVEEFDLCELDQEEPFILCDVCFTTLDNLFATRIVNSHYKEFLGLTTTPHDCMVVLPRDDLLEVPSDTESYSESLLKNAFSEVVNNVVRKELVVNLIEEGLEIEDPVQSTSRQDYQDCNSQDLTTTCNILKDASLEAVEYLKREVEDVTAECRTAWKTMSSLSDRDLRQYVQTRNQQLTLFKSGNEVATSRQSQTLKGFNYVYSVRDDLLVSAAVLSQISDYAIVTERCCPFLATDILNNLGGSKFDLSNLKEISFVQAVPGAGKTFTIISEHRPGVDLVVTQTKAGQEDLCRRVTKTYGSCDETCYRTTASLLVNGVPRRYDTVYFDEAAQQHAGLIAWVASLTRCRRMLCFGDKKQIPFIPRVTHFDCSLAKLDTIVETSRFLTKTYRVPEHHLPLITPFYDDIPTRLTVVVA